MREHNLSLDQILNRIDYAYLKPYGNVREFLEFLERARSFPFRAICVPPCLIKKAIEERLDKRIVGVLDFPFAYSTTLTKIAALEEMLNLGVKEVDIPLNIIWLKSQEIKPLKKELSLFRRIAEECILKGIIESPVLTDEEIELAVKLLAEAGFDYVKTSTGFSGKGTSLEEVKKIKEYARGRMRIKASGGIRTLDQVLDFLSAGADLIGTSHGFEIALEALKEMEEGLDYAEAYIDGACLGNPGPGGFAVIIKEGDEETVLVGSEPETTNNRMELKALICALSYFKEPKRIKVYTDSEYLLRGAVEWLPKWKAQGFRTSERNPVKNRDLWEEIDRLMSIHKVTFEKVKAHSGVLLNEKADRLAKEQAKKWQKKPS